MSTFFANVHLDSNCTALNKVAYQYSEPSDKAPDNVRATMSYLSEQVANGTLKNGDIVPCWLQINVIDDSKPKATRATLQVNRGGETVTVEAKAPEAPAPQPTADADTSADDDIPF